MTNADGPRFGELMALLSETFNEPVSGTRATAYWLALEDLDIRWIEHAVRTSLRESEFFPRPAHLRHWAERKEWLSQAHQKTLARGVRVLLGQLANAVDLQLEQDRQARLTPAEREAEAQRARAAAPAVQDLAWWKAHWAAEDERTGRWRKHRTGEEA